MDEVKIIEILVNFSPVMQISDILSSLTRTIGWWLINALTFISGGMETVVDKIYSSMDFFNSEGISQLITQFKPLIWATLGVSILFVAYQLMINRKFQKDGLLVNVLLSIMVIMMLPSLMVDLNKITKSAIKSVNSPYKTTAEQIIKDNLTDLYYLDKNNFDSLENKNNIPEELVSKIFINEEVEDGKVENKDVFKNKLNIDTDGEKKVTKLGKVFGVFSEKYYRYHLNFFIIIITLACTTVTQLFTAIKVAQLIFELAFTKLFATMYAFADISSGQRLKDIVKNILSIFAVIFSTALLLKLYLLYSNWITTIDNDNIFLKIFLMIGGAFVVIDGPNIIERTLGIDAGIKSGLGVVTGAYSSMKMGGELAKGLGKATGFVASATAAGTGIASGAYSEMKDLKSNNGNGEENNSSTGNNKGGYFGADKDNFKDETGSPGEKFSKEPDDLEQEMKNSNPIDIDTMLEKSNGEDMVDGSIPQNDILDGELDKYEDLNNKGINDNLQQDNIDSNMEKDMQNFKLDTDEMSPLQSKIASGINRNRANFGGGDIEDIKPYEDFGRMTGKVNLPNGGLNDDKDEIDIGNINLGSEKSKINMTQDVNDFNEEIKTSGINIDERINGNKGNISDETYGKTLGDSIKNNQTVNKIKTNYDVGKNTGKKFAKDINKISNNIKNYKK
ncbi:TPA: pLS20_p028 family conjugation system transmembrane protein [Clostridioides difficile]